MPCEDKLCLGKEVGEEDCVLGVRKPGGMLWKRCCHPSCWLAFWAFISFQFAFLLVDVLKRKAFRYHCFCKPI